MISKGEDSLWLMMTFFAGDTFEKLEDEDEQGWCKGRKDGKVGLYPANYIEVIGNWWESNKNVHFDKLYFTLWVYVKIIIILFLSSFSLLTYLAGDLSGRWVLMAMGGVVNVVYVPTTTLVLCIPYPHPAILI